MTSERLSAKMLEEIKWAKFTVNFNAVAKLAHQMAKDKGFWDTGSGTSTETHAIKLALIHTELSEALEALRLHDPPSDKLPGVSNFADEMADVVIRVMDLCESRSIPLGSIIMKKLECNMGRKHKHGGKAF